MLAPCFDLKSLSSSRETVYFEQVCHANQFYDTFIAVVPKSLWRSSYFLKISGQSWKIDFGPIFGSTIRVQRFRGKIFFKVMFKLFPVRLFRRQVYCVRANLDWHGLLSWERESIFRFELYFAGRVVFKTKLTSWLGWMQLNFFLPADNLKRQVDLQRLTLHSAGETHLLGTQCWFVPGPHGKKCRWQAGIKLPAPSAHSKCNPLASNK